jgi:hypothetical protein
MKKNKVKVLLENILKESIEDKSKIKLGTLWQDKRTEFHNKQREERKKNIVRTAGEVADNIEKVNPDGVIRENPNSVEIVLYYSFHAQELQEHFESFPEVVFNAETSSVSFPLDFGLTYEELELIEDCCQQDDSMSRYDNDDY